VRTGIIPTAHNLAAATAPQMNPTRLLMLVTGAAAAAAAPADDLRHCRSLPDAAPRLACYDALPLPAVAPAGPAANKLPIAAPVDSGEAGFGLQDPTRGKVAAVHSSIAGRFEGWRPRSRIRLSNGQVWEVTDDSRAAVWLMDPKVMVRRAALGSFMMEVEGLKEAARVQRVE
jgi:hypothetical protein